VVCVSVCLALGCVHPQRSEPEKVIAGTVHEVRLEQPEVEREPGSAAVFACFDLCGFSFHGDETTYGPYRVLSDAGEVGRTMVDIEAAESVSCGTRIRPRPSEEE
jgi:hypothetical protein